MILVHCSFFYRVFMQILTSFIVNILALKLHPEKMNKKNPGCMPPVPTSGDSLMRSWELYIAFRPDVPLWISQMLASMRDE